MSTNSGRWPASLIRLTGSLNDELPPYPALKYDFDDPRHPYHGMPVLDLLFSTNEKASFSFARDLRMVILYIKTRSINRAPDSRSLYNANIAVALYKAHSHRALDNRERPLNFCHDYLPELKNARRQLMACEGDQRAQDLLWQLNDIIRRLRDPPTGEKSPVFLPSPKAELERIINLFEADRHRRRSLFERCRIQDAIEEEIAAIDEDRSFGQRAVADPRLGHLWAELKTFVWEWPIPYAASSEDGKEIARKVLQAFEEPSVRL